MKTNHPGCITTSGLVTTALALVAIVVIGLLRGGVLFSPGALNAQVGGVTLRGVRSHAEINACGDCHTPPVGQSKMADRCVACHTDLTQDPHNFHNVMIAQGQDIGCHACHTDHNGAQASLTIAGMENFPHEAVGYSLKAHQKMADGALFVCADCHGNGVASFDPAICASCHADLDAAFTQSHTDTFGVVCLDCHDGLDSYGEVFDHNRVAFSLGGKHAPLGCDQCHLGARSISELAAAPQDCYACHAADDEHAGQFGTDCAQCHTTDGWEDATFDHSLAAFPLTGRHVTVACEDCHVNDVFAGTPQDCNACHAADDEHGGQFGTDCAQCHTTDSWEDASFDHSLAAFPLTGAHLEVTCAGCHTNGPSGMIFAGTPTACAACHAEPAYHTGLFDSECAACHTTTAWTPAEFDQAHLFPMNHGESGVSACRVCHSDTLQTYTCYGCHEHTAQNIASEHREEGITDFTDCTRCHPTGQEGD